VVRGQRHLLWCRDKHRAGLSSQLSKNSSGRPGDDDQRYPEKQVDKKRLATGWLLAMIIIAFAKSASQLTTYSDSF